MKLRSLRAWLGSCAALVAVVAAGAASVGCAAAAPESPAPGEDPKVLKVSTAALTADDAIARAEEWVTAKLPYCQSPNHQSDPDTSCASVCTRPDNPAWDPYRSDCSGLVSWAWGLPAPGRTTAELAPAVTDITSVIPAASLRRGDAVNIPHDHTMLFKDWITPGTRATFIEEPGCSATPDYAHEFDSDVTISGTSIKVAYNGMTFTAIRYDALVPSGGDAGASPDAGGVACTVSTTGASGECITTADCAAMPGYESTPGYCPGAADIQCCTAIAGYDAGAPADGATSTPDAATMSPPPSPDASTGASDGGRASDAGGGTAPTEPTSGASDAGETSASGDDAGPAPHRGSGATAASGGCTTGSRGEGAPCGWLSIAGFIGLASLTRKHRRAA
jgi:hypothetical protein